MKKYLIPALIFVLVGASFYLYLRSDSAIADLIAAKVKNAILEKANKDQAERTAYFKNLYDAEHAIRVNVEMEKDIAVITAKKNIGDLKIAQNEIKKIKDCPDREIALNFNLDLCQKQYAKSMDEMDAKYNGLDLSYRNTIKAKDWEIGELRVSVDKYSGLYADTASKYVKFVAKSRRGRTIWFGLGVGAALVLSSLVR